MTRSILSEHAPIAPKHLVKNHGASFHWLRVFLQAFCSLLTGSILCFAVISSAVCRLLHCHASAALRSVLPGPVKHSRPHSPKTTAIFEAFTVTWGPSIKKFAAAWYFKAQKIKTKNIIFGEGFCNFFISALHFWIKPYTNFLNLTKFISQHLISPALISHRNLFFYTAQYRRQTRKGAARVVT